jgi:hypothetical protein
MKSSEGWSVSELDLWLTTTLIHTFINKNSNDQGMPFCETGDQLIEAMNSKRRSPRTKQPVGAPRNKVSPVPPSTSAPPSSNAAHVSESDMSSATMVEETPSGMTQTQPIRVYEGNWQQEMLPQLLSALTALTVQFQQQHQLQVELTQTLAQVAQALTAGGGVNSIGGSGAGNRLGMKIAKDNFADLNSKDLKKSHAKGSAEEKLRRAFQAIVDHNEAENRPGSEKWAVNQNALAELTGCNRPAIKQFLKQYDAEIEAHHQQHQLLPRHNYAHGKVGIKITDIIHW